MISMHHKGAGARSYQGSQWCNSAACSPLWWFEHEGCRCHTRWCSHAPRCPGSLVASSSPQYCWPGDGHAESWADLVHVILRRERQDIPVERSDIEKKSENWKFLCFYHPGHSQMSLLRSTQWPDLCRWPSSQTPGRSTLFHAPDLERGRKEVRIRA